MTQRGFLARLRNGFRAARLRWAGCVVGKNVWLGRDISATAGVVIGDDTIVRDGVFFQGNVRVGRGCRIEKLAVIVGNVEIGDQTAIGDHSQLSTTASAFLKIGKDVIVNLFSVIGAAESVEIGDHCIFAAYVHITDATHGIDDPAALIKNAPWRSVPVSIGENVWLGSAVMVAMGGKIGAGSVIGAKSLVNSDIPAMSVAYGVPARAMRSRLPSTGQPS